MLGLNALPAVSLRLIEPHGAEADNDGRIRMTLQPRIDYAFDYRSCAIASGRRSMPPYIPPFAVVRRMIDRHDIV
jgi:hypothetical protein